MILFFLMNVYFQDFKFRNGYNIFESRNTKNEKSLIVQISLNHNFLEIIISITNKKIWKYIFPGNLDYHKIIEIINMANNC